MCNGHNCNCIIKAFEVTKTADGDWQWKGHDGIQYFSLYLSDNITCKLASIALSETEVNYVEVHFEQA